MIERTSENWRKSSRSNGQAECVEAGNRENEIVIRDSKLGEASPVLAVTPADWRLFVQQIRADGNFTGKLTVGFVGAEIRVRAGSVGPALIFTSAEWNAFVAGVELGEFDLSEDGMLPALASA